MPNIERIATACKDTALAMAMHPYSVADAISKAAHNYPESEVLAYEIKSEIYTTTDPKTVIWVLREPEKPRYL